MNHKQLKEKALSNESVRREYDSLEPEFKFGIINRSTRPKTAA